MGQKDFPTSCRERFCAPGDLCPFSVGQAFQPVGQVDGLERPSYMNSSILSDEFFQTNILSTYCININWLYKDFINQAIGT
jgi:hypothetical protein